MYKAIQTHIEHHVVKDWYGAVAVIDEEGVEHDFDSVADLLNQYKEKLNKIKGVATAMRVCQLVGRDHPVYVEWAKQIEGIIDE